MMTTTARKWRNKINIKHLLNGDTSENHVKEVAEAISTGLQKIHEIEDKRKDLHEEDKDDILLKIVEVKDNFDFVVVLFGLSVDDRIKDFSMAEPLVEILDGYMDELYDLGDERVTTKKGITEKFMWIG